MGMESESSLGNSLCIFTTDSLSELSQAVEEQGISLGDFLTGLYENRTNSSAQAPVKLADLYRSCHTEYRPASDTRYYSKRSGIDW